MEHQCIENCGTSSLASNGISMNFPHLCLKQQCYSFLRSNIPYKFFGLVLVWCLPNDTELYMANRWTLEMSWPSVFGGNFHIHSRVSTVRIHTSNGTTNNVAKSHLLTKNGRKPTGAPGLPHVDTKEILQHFRLAIQASQGGVYSDLSRSLLCTTLCSAAPKKRFPKVAIFWS